MAFTEKTFARVIIAATDAGTPTTIYTGTATDIVKNIIMCNVHTADVTVSVWFVANGGGANVDANKICSTLTIPANDFVQISTYLPMQTTGDKITAICSVANKANMIVSGASVT